MADEKTVTLGVADYRIGSFDPGVRGVQPILNANAGGTDVPEKHEDAVRKEAKDRGVLLRKM